MAQNVSPGVYTKIIDLSQFVGGTINNWFPLCTNRERRR